MGIEGYEAWLRKEFPAAFVAAQSPAGGSGAGKNKKKNAIRKRGTCRTFNHVFVDVNGVLHTATRTTPTEGRCNSKIVATFEEILSVVRPTVSLMLSADGPAPAAKLTEQRKRRRKAEGDSIAKAELQRTGAYSGSAKKRKYKSLDRLMVTPGTEFMLGVHKLMHSYAGWKLSATKGPAPPAFIRVSSPLTPGEGEVKMLEQLYRQQRKEECEIEDLAHGSCCFVGSDADLLVMAIGSGSSKLSVYRESSSGKATQCSFFDVDRFETCIERKFYSGKKMPRAFAAGIRRDFALISLIGGNDYLPGVHDTTVAKMWRAYTSSDKMKKVGASIVTMDGSHDIAIDLASLVDMMPKDSSNQKANPQAAHQYIIGLLWVTKLYLCGVAPCNKWMYVNMSKRPSIGDLRTLAESTPVWSTRGLWPVPAPPPLQPHACGLAVLPRKGGKYLPKAVERLMHEPSPIAKYYDRCAVCDALRVKLYPFRQAVQRATSDKQRVKAVDALKEAEVELHEHNASAAALELHANDSCAPSLDVVAHLVGSIPGTALSGTERASAKFLPETLYARASTGIARAWKRVGRFSTPRPGPNHLFPRGGWTRNEMEWAARNVSYRTRVVWGTASTSFTGVEKGRKRQKMSPRQGSDDDDSDSDEEEILLKARC